MTKADSNNARRVHRVAYGKEGCRIAAIFNDLRFADAAQARELVKAGQIPARNNANGASCARNKSRFTQQLGDIEVILRKAARIVVCPDSDPRRLGWW